MSDLQILKRLLVEEWYQKVREAKAKLTIPQLTLWLEQYSENIELDGETLLNFAVISSILEDFASLQESEPRAWEMEDLSDDGEWVKTGPLSRTPPKPSEVALAVQNILGDLFASPQPAPVGLEAEIDYIEHQARHSATGQLKTDLCAAIQRIRALIKQRNNQ